MNWDQIEGNWKQFKGNAQQHWGKLTDDHLDVVAGKREVLSGKIQEIYGVSKDEADKQLSNWQQIQKEIPGANQHMSAQNGGSDAPIKR